MNTVQNGKGSKVRGNGKLYRLNYDTIFRKKKKVKNKNINVPIT